MKLINDLADVVSLHRIVRLRHRHFLTRNNKLRLRYVASTIAITAVIGGSIAPAGNSIAFVPQSIDFAAYSRNADAPVVKLASHSPQDGIFIVDDENETAAEDWAATDTLAALEEAQEALPLEPREEILEIGSGDTLAGVLQDVGVSGAEAYKIVKEMAKHYDPRSVKAGQAVAVRLEPGESGLELAEMNLKIDPIKELVIERTANAEFQSEIKEKKVVLQTKAAKAKIESSLYGSAARAGIPASVVAEMIRIYSYQVDFQRDIREGDKVEIMYETYETEDGDFARYGNVLFANLVVSGKSMPVFRFAPKDGQPGYYTPDGKSTKKALMRTPIDGARMSSGFGMRRHPVLGYNKMHQGVDFAAPRGTPIYAAGDGVVEFVGRNGGYGNYVRIRHNSNVKTAYAHMHKFAKGLSNGSKVRQGEVIGYVGSTGRSTGPHLHFEVLKNNVQINPSSLALQDTNVLAGADLKKFKSEIAAFRQQYASKAEGMKYAENFVTQ